MSSRGTEIDALHRLHRQHHEGMVRLDQSMMPITLIGMQVSDVSIAVPLQRQLFFKDIPW